VAHLAERMCSRKYGIGADGLLVMEKSKIANIKMRIFNADGSEAQMCGNGARCTALWVKQRLAVTSSRIKIETKAGLIEAEAKTANVKIKLTDPKNIKLDTPIKVNEKLLKINFVNTGVPHTIIFVEGLNEIDVDSLGRTIRYHEQFKPSGTNVNFVEIIDNAFIKVRTYERGVEGETLACGTGAVASALITNYRLPITNFKFIRVLTRGGEVLKVYFDKVGDKFKEVWLEGKAKIIYEGRYYV
jgi:diaminopimelate epimerase